MKKGLRIVKHFTIALNESNYNTINIRMISSNVFKTKINENEVLLYVKGRSEKPFKWGVTRNIVKKLESQNLDWYIILLYSTNQSGYFLSSGEVIEKINRKIWPLANDGDYKPAEGNYLKNCKKFTNIDELINLIDN